MRTGGPAGYPNEIHWVTQRHWAPLQDIVAWTTGKAPGRPYVASRITAPCGHFRDVGRVGRGAAIALSVSREPTESSTSALPSECRYRGPESCFVHPRRPGRCYMVGTSAVSYADGVRLAAAVFAVVAFLTGVLRGALSWFRRTFAARRDLRLRLNQLACGCHKGFVEMLHGQPVFVKHPGQDEELLTFRSRHTWLSVLFFKSQVIAFSITTTSRWFKFRVYTLTGGQSRIKLGKDTFDRLGKDPLCVEGYLGARRYGYRELHYYGNPGYYQYYVFGNNAVGHKSHAIPKIEGFQSGRFVEDTQVAGTPCDQAPDDDELRAYREQARANTLTVLGPRAQEEMVRIIRLVEVEQDEVRLYHEKGRLLHLSGWLRYWRYRFRQRIAHRG